MLKKTDLFRISASIFLSLWLLFTPLWGKAENTKNGIGPLLDAANLNQRIAQNDPTLFILDIRPDSLYWKGHIPGAHNLWRPQITDPEAEHKGMRAPAKTIETLLKNLGANQSSTIVCYDAKGNPDAARMWWLLKQYGFDWVALLDGGLNFWEAEGFATTADSSKTQLGNFSLSANSPFSESIDLEELKPLLNTDEIFLIDTRSLAEHEGTKQKKGAARAGRIPGSLYYDWAQSIDFFGDKRILPKDTLLKKLGWNYIDDSKPVVTYCQSGVRSAHTTFVLTQILGFSDVRNYDGSWIEYSAHAELPIEFGPQAYPEPPTMPFNWWAVLIGFVVLLGLILVWKKRVG